VTTPKTKPSRDAYYREAASWAESRDDMLRSSRRIAWIVAGVAVVVALFEAIALVLLTPLKTVEPYTLMVDRNTGFVQALKPIDANRLAPDAALTQSFLVQYVIARESFDVDELQANYRKVTLWSADQARSDYVTGVQVTNPGSPLARYPHSTTIETRVKSVSPLGGMAALVRFETQRRDAGDHVLPPRSWVAVIRYRFSTEPLQLSDRFINPLGFQVLRYRKDQEQVLPPETVTAPAPILQTQTPPLAQRPTLPGYPAPNGSPAPLVPPPTITPRLPVRGPGQSEVKL
jgi:type IV secretion system protein VirB8